MGILVSWDVQILTASSTIKIAINYGNAFVLVKFIFYTVVGVSHAKNIYVFRKW